MADDQAPPPKKRKKLKKNAADEAPSKTEGKEGEGEGEGGGGSKKKTIIIFAAAAALLIGVGVGVGIFAGSLLTNDEPDPEGEELVEEREEEPEEEEEVEPEEDRHSIYVTVGKLLATVDHNGSTRYIQAEMDLVGYDKEVMDEAQHDMPAIRNRLLLLFASQDFDVVRTVEGREALRADSITAVNDVLGLGPKGDKIEDAYFTAFVLQ